MAKTSNNKNEEIIIKLSGRITPRKRHNLNRFNR